MLIAAAVIFVVFISNDYLRLFNAENGDHKHETLKKIFVMIGLGAYLLRDLMQNTLR